jgi:cytosylglucuronate decarboxylase
MAEPRILIIRLLEACNAGCFMCGFAHSTDPYRFTAEHARDLAEKNRDAGLRLIRFTGGEPLMVEDLPAIIRNLSATGAAISSITNGWYLAERIDALAEAGLRQVVVSLDSVIPDQHDQYRRTPGLWHRALEGIRYIRRNWPDIIIRVNTVAGPHNANMLCDFYDMLGAEGIDQWSIIPIKWNEKFSRYRDGASAADRYQEFRAHIDPQRLPRLLGHSDSWAGRTESETAAFFAGGRPFTPRGNCQVVHNVRYYTPKDGVTYPCNCVPHRIEGTDMGWHGDTPFAVNPARNIVQWLNENGPSRCRGCEPVNAALGEGAIDLDHDVFGFLDPKTGTESRICHPVSQ